MKIICICKVHTELGEGLEETTDSRKRPLGIIMVRIVQSGSLSWMAWTSSKPLVLYEDKSAGSPTMKVYILYNNERTRQVAGFFMSFT